MLYLEQKYIGILSLQLTGFKKVDKHTFNFRCPVCGDSEHKRKKRGYLYLKRGKYSFFCHNCSASMSFDRFLKEQNSEMYNQYVFEKIQEDKPYRIKKELEVFEDKFKTPKYIKESPLKTLWKISQLSHKHPAKEYIVSRNIPNKFHSDLFYVDGFKRWINGIIPDKFEDTNKDDGRIIIPLVDNNGDLVGVQGRSLISNDKVRYITIMFDENASRVYGLDRVNKHKDIYVVEGPFDSMFIDNSIATCGGNLTSELIHLDSIISKDKFIVVYDNEPRNKEVVRNIGKAINLGYKVCIWPSDMKYKDINQMINAGECDIDIKRIIDNRTFSDVRATLELQSWKR